MYLGEYDKSKVIIKLKALSEQTYKEISASKCSDRKYILALFKETHKFFDQYLMELQGKSKMWYVFSMDYLIAEARTKKEVMAGLTLLRFKSKRISKGYYIVTDQGENAKLHYKTTYSVFDGLEKAFEHGFNAQWEEHIFGQVQRIKEKLVELDKAEENKGKGNWLNLSDEDIKIIVKKPAETLQELVKRQNEESYQLGKKHGAIEELEKIKAEMQDNLWYSLGDRKFALKIIDNHIKELNNEKEN